MALDAVAQLEDKVSGPANAMCSAIAQLQAKLGGIASSVASTIGALSGIGSAASVVSGLFSSASSGGIKGLGDALQKISPQADEACNGLNQGRDALGRFTSAGSGAQGSAGQVGQMLSALGPYGAIAAVGIALATAAIVAFTAAAIQGMAAAIAITQQRSAMLATFGALAGGVEGGKATLAIVDKLSKLPFTTEQVGKWATSLQSAGFQGKALENAIKAVAAATALMGESGGAAAEKMLKQLEEGGAGATALIKSLQQGGAKANRLLADMGLQTKDIAAAAGMTEAQFKKAHLSAAEMQKAIEKALQKKGAGPLDELGMTFPVLIAKLREGLASLFDGLGPSVKPFMAAVKELFGEFSKGGGAIKVLKPIITAVFGTLFDWATRAVTFLHEAFLQIVIAGLKVRIAIDPIIQALKKLAANADFIRGLKVALVLLALPFVLCAVAALIVVAVVLVVIAVFAALVYAAIRVGGAIIGGVIAAFTKVKAAIKGFKLPDLAAAAGNFVMSFVSGIASKIGSVVAAMVGMGKSAKAGLLSALGIASPSKVAIEAAGNVTSSFADKVDDGKDETQSAFAGLVKVPPGASGKNGKSGGKDSKAALARALERIASALEASPGFRELLMAALEEEERSGSDMDPA